MVILESTGKLLGSWLWNILINLWLFDIWRVDCVCLGGETCTPISTHPYLLSQPPNHHLHFFFFTLKCWHFETWFIIFILFIYLKNLSNLNLNIPGSQRGKFGFRQTVTKYRLCEFYCTVLLFPMTRNKICGPHLITSKIWSPPPFPAISSSFLSSLSLSYWVCARVHLLSIVHAFPKMSVHLEEPGWSIQRCRSLFSPHNFSVVTSWWFAHPWKFWLAGQRCPHQSSLCGERNTTGGAGHFSYKKIFFFFFFFFQENGLWLVITFTPQKFRLFYSKQTKYSGPSLLLLHSNC